MEPLSFKGRKGSGLPGGRDAYADASLRAPRRRLARSTRTRYRLWGRLLYNPDAEPEIWRRPLRQRFGAAAEAAEAALARASRILPLVTTARTALGRQQQLLAGDVHATCRSSMRLCRIRTATRPAPAVRHRQPARPGALLRIDDFAAELLKGESTGQYSPLEVPNGSRTWRRRPASNSPRRKGASRGRSQAPSSGDSAIDVAIQCGLGQFFAHKFRAGVFYALYERGRIARPSKQAVKATAPRAMPGPSCPSGPMAFTSAT